MRNIIGDLDEFLKRYIKKNGLSPVVPSVVPATSAPIDSICERAAEELNVVPLHSIREKEDAIDLSRVQNQLRISHGVINSLQETARLSQLLSQKDRLQKEALSNRVRLLTQELEGLKPAKKQQGCDNLASNIDTALISSDRDASVDTVFSIDLSPEAVQERRDETKVAVKHTTGTVLKVSVRVFEDYRNCEPTYGYQMACYHSDWWWIGSQEAYEEFGHPFIMPESTIPIDVWISNKERGINTLAAMAYLQFAELTGFDKDCDGKYINGTLSRIQQCTDAIYQIAQDFTKQGYPCNNPAESIIIINAVDGLHDKKWAATADKDLLKTLDKLFLLKIKTMRKVNKESNIQVSSKYTIRNAFHSYYYCNLFVLQFVSCFH